MSERVAVVEGLRTPFVKAGTVFRHLTMQQLSEQLLTAFFAKSSKPAEEIDRFVYSSVLLDSRTPNLAREVWFGAGLPKTVYAHSVSNNCISGLVAIADISDAIANGRIKSGLAGGVESMSKPTLVFNPKAQDIFHELTWARSFGQKLSQAIKLRPSSFFPSAPSPKEPSTGLTMGQHMELTAQELAIPREEQDELAYSSHMNAYAATEDGRLTSEIAAVEGVIKDSIVRGNTSVEKLAKLKPVFDRTGKGTLTAGNSSSLTDGASVVHLMSASQAMSEGREALAYIKDFEFSAISPDEGLLMAPAVAVPRLLKRHGLSFSDFDLIEVHEAFAAQVLANIKAWEEGGAEEALGKLDRTKLNTLGGSIAIGHPFAATGARIVTTLANELKRTGGKRGLVSICAAGAMAGAMILET